MRIGFGLTRCPFTLNESCAMEVTELDRSLLLTDYYELTMLQAYQHAGVVGEACFEFFFRRLPPERNFFVVAGLEPLLKFVLGARFRDDELAWLASEGGFSRAALDYFAQWRFTGAIDAMPEGTLAFPNEPVVRVVAPLPEAQLLESRLINLMHMSTLIASKAVRCTLAARGRLVTDFGMRRAHGAEAARLAARSAYIAGLDGTATVQAGRNYGIPLFGTMAHSYIQAYGDETRAFEAFAAAHRGPLVLLIDTYDTEAAAHEVVRLAQRGMSVQAVRIDSGDLSHEARTVRAILDQGGCHDIRIYVSGSLDEARIADLLAAGAPIDGFGVGTALVTSADAPYLDCAYKLTEYQGEPRRKLSQGKASLAGRKQVWRHYADDGTPQHDVIGLADEQLPGTPLLAPVVRDGLRLEPAPPLAAARTRCARQLAGMKPPWRSLDSAPTYPVTVTRAVEAAGEAHDRSHGFGGSSN